MGSAGRPDKRKRKLHVLHRCTCLIGDRSMIVPMSCDGNVVVVVVSGAAVAVVVSNADVIVVVVVVVSGAAVVVDVPGATVVVAWHCPSP